MLGLAPRLALWLTMPPLGMAPVSLPGPFGSEVAFKLGEIAVRPLVTVGSAGALALVLLALGRRAPALLPATVPAVIAIFGLAIVALSAVPRVSRSTPTRLSSGGCSRSRSSCASGSGSPARCSFVRSARVRR